MAIISRISDETFFTDIIDTSLPWLGDVAALVREKRFEAARAAFVTAVRARLNPDAFLAQPFEAGENPAHLEGESKLETADRICSRTLISCGVPHAFGDRFDWEINPTYNQYNEWPWQLNRHCEFQYLAYAYRQTGDEKYAACFVEIVESWMRQAVPPAPYTDHGDTQCWRTIEAGIRMCTSWPYAFFVFLNSPLFTDDLLIDWYKSMYDHGRRLSIDYSNANWVTMEMAGLSYIGILYTELKNAKEWLTLAVEILRQELHKQIYADGFQYELTTSYHNCFVKNYYRLFLAADTYGVTLPNDFDEIIGRALDIFMKLPMPDGRMPDINDGTNERASVLLAPKMYRYPNRLDMRWRLTDGAEGTPPPYASVALPNAGMLVCRSDWSTDAVYGLFDGGRFGRGHQHEDKLSLLVYANGKLILTEGGNYAYDTSPMRRYVSHTRSHNTVTINGLGQNRWEKYKWEDDEINLLSDMKWAVTEDYDYATARYDEGYGPDFLPVVHTRGVLFLKKPGHGLKPFFIVFDRITAADPVAFEAIWHVDSEQLLLTNRTAVTPELTIMADGAGLQCSLVRGQEYPEWQGFASTGFTQGNHKPVYALRYTGYGAQESFATLIYPEGSSHPIAHFHQKEAGAVSLTLQSGVVLVFNERDYQ